MKKDKGPEHQIQEEKKVGKQAKAHPHLFNYKTWGLTGLSGDKSDPIKEMKEVRPEDSKQYLAALAKLVDLTNYAVVSTKRVQHFQGKENGKPINLLWLRLERTDKRNAGVGGEHISATFDDQTEQLMGLACLQEGRDGSDFVTHQQALEVAIKFLRANAPDLMPKEVVIPKLTLLAKGSHIAFSPSLKIGNLEVHWIDDHKELLTCDNKAKETHGMKVKMQLLDKEELYAWVIVDKNGAVQVFERNISWDFQKFQRNTQMWLHDPWLKEQGISTVKNRGSVPLVSDSSEGTFENTVNHKIGF